MQISATDIRRIFGFNGYPVNDWPDAGLRLERDGVWVNEPDWGAVDAGKFTPDEEDFLIRWFADGKHQSGDYARPVLPLPCELHDLIAFIDNKADCKSNCAYFDDALDGWRYPLHELAEQEPQQATQEVSASDSQLTKREKQIRAIVTEAKNAGFDRLRIPDGGKSKLREACKTARPDLFGGGDDPFNDAWKCAISENPPRFRMENHIKFARR